MAHSISSKKRGRQNIARRERNRARKSAVKTQVRKVVEAIRQQDPDTARRELNRAYQVIDQTAAKGTLHRNTAARKKAVLAKRLNRFINAAG